MPHDSCVVLNKTGNAEDNGEAERHNGWLHESLTPTMIEAGQTVTRVRVEDDGPNDAGEGPSLVARLISTGRAFTTLHCTVM